VNDKEGEKDQQ